MKIALFTDTLFPEQVNGVARVARRQADVLGDLGHDVRIWSVQNVPSVPFWGYAGERIALPLGRAYREAVLWKPDIIHAHTPFRLGREAVQTARALEVPLVGTHHTFFDHYLKHVHLDSEFARRLSWKYLVRHYNQYDLVLSPSEALLRGMRSQGLVSETKFFPNSVHSDLFVPATEQEKLIQKTSLGIHGPCMVYMGRVSYEKSIDQVIKAFALVQETVSGATLLIIGDGPERKKLEALAEELGVRGQCIFTGILHGEHLVHAFHAGDVFVTASKSENMPLSVLEAMSVGLPVVGVDALGIPEIVKDGINGFIVTPDDPEALAEKVVELLQNKELRAVFSARSRELALQYGEREHALRLIELYTELLQS